MNKQSDKIIKRGGRVRHNGYWVSSHWYNSHVAKIFTGNPVPVARKKRVLRSVLEKAWLKQQLDALVNGGELTRDLFGRYGLPEWKKGAAV